MSSPGSQMECKAQNMPSSDPEKQSMLLALSPEYKSAISSRNYYNPKP